MNVNVSSLLSLLIENSLMKSNMKKLVENNTFLRSEVIRLRQLIREKNYS